MQKMNKKEVQIAYSSACIWPLSSYLEGITIHSIGYSSTKGKAEALELLPGHAFVKSIEAGDYPMFGDELFVSVHDSWKRDRRQEQELGLKTSMLDRLLSSNLFFPSEVRTQKAIRKVHSLYDSPIAQVYHWPEDTQRIINPALEIHPYVGRMKPEDETWEPERILKWIEEGEEDKTKKGV